MKKLRRFGFFRELGHGDPGGESLRSLVSDEPLSHATEIASYLSQGEVLIACPGIVHDVLDPDKPVIGPPDILTDGEWAWPRDLLYYVSKYNVRIPEELEQWMESNRWELRKETLDLANVEL